MIIAAKDNAAIGAAGLEEGATLPIDLFCALPHVLRSIDGSMTGSTDGALAEIGRTRRVTLALPHFQAVALAVASGRYLAAVPVQFANSAAASLPLAIYAPPVAIPVPQIKMYWHSRHDDETPHQWLRNRVLAKVQALGFAED